MSREVLIGKLNNKTAVIGIVGLGYVGLPLMLRFVEVGYKVLGIDVDEKKVALLNQGDSCIEHIPAEKIAQAVQTNGFRATTDFSQSAQADALILRLVVRICSASGEKTDNPAPADTTCPRAVLPEVVPCL